LHKGAFQGGYLPPPRSGMHRVDLRMALRSRFLLVAFATLFATASASAAEEAPELVPSTANVTFFFLRVPAITPLDERFTIAPGGERLLTAIVENPLDTEQAVVLEPVVYRVTGKGETLVPDPDRVRATAWPTALTLAPRERVLVQIHVSVSKDLPVGEAIFAGLMSGQPGGASSFMQVVSHGEVVAPAAGGADAHDPLLAALVAGAGLAVAGGAVIGIAARRDPAILTPLLALYSRLKRADVLDQKTRERVHRLVAEQPGIRWADLKRLSGLGTGALLHHLALLERHEFVSGRREGRHRRYYPAGARMPTPEPFPLTPSQARVVAALADGGLTQRALADRLGITQQGASYHLKALERRGYVVVERRGVEWTWSVTEAGAAKGSPAWAEATRPTPQGGCP